MARSLHGPRLTLNAPRLPNSLAHHHGAGGAPSRRRRCSRPLRRVPRDERDRRPDRDGWTHPAWRTEAPIVVVADLRFPLVACAQQSRLQRRVLGEIDRPDRDLPAVALGETGSSPGVASHRSARGATSAGMGARAIPTPEKRRARPWASRWPRSRSPGARRAARSSRRRGEGEQEALTGAELAELFSVGRSTVHRASERVDGRSTADRSTLPQVTRTRAPDLELCSRPRFPNRAGRAD